MTLSQNFLHRSICTKCEEGYTWYYEKMCAHVYLRELEEKNKKVVMSV